MVRIILVAEWFLSDDCENILKTEEDLAITTKMGIWYDRWAYAAYLSVRHSFLMREPNIKDWFGVAFYNLIWKEPNEILEEKFSRVN